MYSSTKIAICEPMPCNLFILCIVIVLIPYQKFIVYPNNNKNFYILDVFMYYFFLYFIVFIVSSVFLVLIFL